MEIVETCGCMQNKFKLFITPKAMAKINIMMIELGNKNWFAYYSGKIFIDNQLAIVDDIILPKDAIDKSNVVGVVYSNKYKTNEIAEMKFENDLSTIIIKENEKYIFKTTVKVKTKCDKFIFLNSDFEVLCTIENADAFKKEIKENLEIDDSLDKVVDLNSPINDLHSHPHPHSHK